MIDLKRKLIDPFDDQQMIDSIRLNSSNSFELNDDQTPKSMMNNFQSSKSLFLIDPSSIGSSSNSLSLKSLTSPLSLLSSSSQMPLFNEYCSSKLSILSSLKMPSNNSSSSSSLPPPPPPPSSSVLLNDNNQINIDQNNQNVDKYCSQISDSNKINDNKTLFNNKYSNNNNNDNYFYINKHNHRLSSMIMTILIIIMIIFDPKQCHLVLGEQQTCNYPGSPAHASITFSNEHMIAGTIATYTCDNGYELLGPSRRLCNQNGTWTPLGIPFCVLNVAIGKAAMQSSTVGQGHAQKAVDGSPSSFFNPSTCTMTESESQPWFYVNLLEPVLVQLVRIDFGSSCCQQGRPATITVRVGNNRPDLGTNPLCRKFTGFIEEGRPLYLPCTRPMAGAFVSIQLESNGNNSPLSICELFVYTDHALSIEQCPTFRDQPLGGTSTYDGKCYIFYNEHPLNFENAKKFCEIRGGTLVDETSPALQGFLSWELYRRHRNDPNGQYWLGAIRDPRNQKNWKWINGKDVSISFWNLPMTKENCSRFDGTKGWLWSDTNCQIKLNYMCQHRPLSCGRPERPPNSTVLIRSVDVGQTIEYHCNEGSLLLGPNIRTCMSNGFFSEYAPKCKYIECGQPQSILNGNYVLNNRSRSFMSSLSYHCNDGYVLVGRGNLICDQDGLWNGPPPRCEPVLCPDPPLISNGVATLVSNSTRFDSLVEYHCNNGYELIGDKLIQCNRAGYWEGQPGYCIEIKSSSINFPAATTTTTSTTSTTSTTTSTTTESPSTTSTTTSPPPTTGFPTTFFDSNPIRVSYSGQQQPQPISSIKPPQVALLPVNNNQQQQSNNGYPNIYNTNNPYNSRMPESQAPTLSSSAMTTPSTIIASNPHNHYQYHNHHHGQQSYTTSSPITTITSPSSIYISSTTTTMAPSSSIITTTSKSQTNSGPSTTNRVKPNQQIHHTSIHQRPSQKPTTINANNNHIIDNEIPDTPINPAKNFLGKPSKIAAARLNMGGIIALGIFGGFVFLAAIITIIVIIVRRFKHSHSSLDAQTISTFDSSNGDNPGFYHKYASAWSQLQSSAVLHSGSYKPANLSNRMSCNGNGIDIAYDSHYHNGNNNIGPRQRSPNGCGGSINEGFRDINDTNDLYSRSADRRNNNLNGVSGGGFGSKRNLNDHDNWHRGKY